MERGNAGDKVTPRRVQARKVQSTGTVVVTKELDASKSGLNVYSFFASGGSLAWNKDDNSLGLMISRKMTKAGDGLNHQGCIAVILDSSSLDVVVNRGQTSGHSWNNFITTDDSNYLAVDLGDNYPRGVHVHKISQSVRTTRKVRRS